MGRTNPTYRDALRALEDRWGDYRRALRPPDRERFDRLLAHARNRADAGGNLNGFDPVVAVLLSVALGQAARIDDLERRLGELEGRVDDLDGGTGGRTPDERTRRLSTYLDPGESGDDRSGPGGRRSAGSARDGGG